MAQMREDQEMDMVTGQPIVRRAEKNEIMIDIETLSVKNRAVVLSVGAVAFNRNGPLQDWGTNSFFTRVAIQPQLDAGRVIDAGTISFWMRQSKEAQEEAFGDGNAGSVMDMFSGLRKFVSDMGSKDAAQKVWANSPSFDCMIMQSLAEDFDISQAYQPGMFRDWRDCRTLLAETGTKDYQPTKTWDYPDHHPVGDCLWQIACVTEARRRIATLSK